MDLPKTSTHPTLDFLQNYSVINPLKQELPTVVFESESQCELELRFKICNSGNKNISNFQVTPIILEESEEKICGDWRVIPTENFYTLKIVVNKPKKDFVRCFFRVSFSCSSNDTRSSIDIPIPVCNDKAKYSLACDLFKMFPLKDTIVSAEFVWLMENYNKWATSPLERIRIPTFAEWKNIFCYLWNSDQDLSTLQYNKDLIERILQRWRQWVSLLLKNEDIRTLWNSQEIHLEKLDETKRKLQHHDLRSFVLKFGSTWITNGNAGPIVIVQKYVKDGTIIIDAHYLNYDMIERFGLEYLIMNDKEGTREYWIKRNGDVIHKNHKDWPFKVKQNIESVLSHYDRRGQQSESPSLSSSKKRNHKKIDEGETRPQCSKKCNPSSEIWHYCPCCGEKLQRTGEQMYLNSTTLTPIVSDSSSTDPKDDNIYSESTEISRESPDAPQIDTVFEESQQSQQPQSLNNNNNNNNSDNPQNSNL